MKRVLLTLVLQSALLFAQADNKAPVDYTPKFYGFVNFQTIYDSRQIVAARENHFMLLPKEVLLDKTGADINAEGTMTMASIQTRVGMRLTGPTFLSAKTSGLIETEFMGLSDNDVNSLRIRHAYAKAEWENTTILVGQTWIPLYIPEVGPRCVNSNGGAPYTPFARQPQIRVTQKLGHLSALVAAGIERDFFSTGPNGSANEYLRNSLLPDLFLNLQYTSPQFVCGVGGEYKQLRPLLKTEKSYISTEKATGYALNGYLKFVSGEFSLLAYGVYGANLTSYTMLGGYAVTGVDSATMIRKYSPTKTTSFWTDIAYGKTFEVGLFAGYSMNLGSDDVIVGEYYARAANVDNILRIAPRVQFTEGKLRVSAETQIDAAAYGKNDKNGKVTDTKSVTNYRFVLSFNYYFGD